MKPSGKGSGASSRSSAELTPFSAPILPVVVSEQHMTAQQPLPMPVADREHHAMMQARAATFMAQAQATQNMHSTVTNQTHATSNQEYFASSTRNFYVTNRVVPYNQEESGRLRRPGTPSDTYPGMVSRQVPNLNTVPVPKSKQVTQKVPSLNLRMQQKPSPCCEPSLCCGKGF